MDQRGCRAGLILASLPLPIRCAGSPSGRVAGASGRDDAEHRRLACVTLAAYLPNFSLKLSLQFLQLSKHLAQISDEPPTNVSIALRQFSLPRCPQLPVGQSLLLGCDECSISADDCLIGNHTYGSPIPEHMEGYSGHPVEVQADYC
jgi:hypothetical protein